MGPVQEGGACNRCHSREAGWAAAAGGPRPPRFAWRRCSHERTGAASRRAHRALEHQGQAPAATLNAAIRGTRGRRRGSGRRNEGDSWPRSNEDRRHAKRPGPWPGLLLVMIGSDEDLGKLPGRLRLTARALQPGHVDATTNCLGGAGAMRGHLSEDRRLGLGRPAADARHASQMVEGCTCRLRRERGEFHAAR